MLYCWSFVKQRKLFTFCERRFTKRYNARLLVEHGGRNSFHTEPYALYETMINSHPCRWKRIPLGGGTSGLLSLLSLAAASCETRHPVTSPYPDRTFVPARWRQDATGCTHYRARTAGGVARHEAYFRGQPYAQIRQLLGPPTFLVRKPHWGGGTGPATWSSARPCPRSTGPGQGP